MNLTKLTLICEATVRCDNDLDVDDYLKIQLPKTLTTLVLEFPHGFVRRRVPRLPLRQLPRLKHLTVRGCLDHEDDFRSGEKQGDFVTPHPTESGLEFVYIHKLDMSMNWSSLVGPRLRHLILSGIIHLNRITNQIRLEALTTLEILWCRNVGKSVRKHLTCPSLSHFSLSHEYLHSFSVDFPRWAYEKHQLRVFALRMKGSGVHREKSASFFAALAKSQRETNTPGRCLVQGPQEMSETPIRDSIRYVQEVLTAQDDESWTSNDDNELGNKVQDALKTRVDFLHWVDQERFFYETRETKNVWRTGPFHRDN